MDGLGPDQDGAATLNPANKTFTWNAVTQKFEWADASQAKLFIQGETIREHMDEQGAH